MTKAELNKKYAVLDAWIKKDIGGKAFLFVANAADSRMYCVARPYYGGNVRISDYMTLEQLESFLWGISHAREVRAAARGVGRQRSTLYEQGATVAGLVENGKVIGDNKTLTEGRQAWR